MAPRSAAVSPQTTVCCCRLPRWRPKAIFRSCLAVHRTFGPVAARVALAQRLLSWADPNRPWAFDGEPVMVTNHRTGVVDIPVHNRIHVFWTLEMRRGLWAEAWEKRFRCVHLPRCSVCTGALCSLRIWAVCGMGTTIDPYELGVGKSLPPPRASLGLMSWSFATAQPPAGPANMYPVAQIEIGSGSSSRNESRDRACRVFVCRI